MTSNDAVRRPDGRRRLAAWLAAVVASSRAEAPDAATGPSARVQSVRGEFAALRSNLIYRIEHSALFDDAALLTREFHLALMRWEEAQGSDDDELLQRAASEVEFSFRTARSHAETVGLTHLPEGSRAKAERAIRAARLAERAATGEEREEAVGHVAGLLDALSLYYLPSPTEVPHLLGTPR
ncbi:hypothetical protein [Tessaracoccus sp. ZS01]|nr:hypothetical protein [Tessaracoccus sp. ZS01]